MQVLLPEMMYLLEDSKCDKVSFVLLSIKGYLNLYYKYLKLQVINILEHMLLNLLRWNFLWFVTIVWQLKLLHLLAGLLQFSNMKSTMANHCNIFSVQQHTHSQLNEHPFEEMSVGSCTTVVAGWFRCLNDDIDSS